MMKSIEVKQVLAIGTGAGTGIHGTDGCGIRTGTNGIGIDPEIAKRY
ncbi:hypothetical protein V7138_21425 [Bacillus sp. JJ1533]